jgi:hypothetical protein
VPNYGITALHFDVPHHAQTDSVWAGRGDGPAAVGIPASYPEVTAVGGTEFNEAGGQWVLDDGVRGTARAARLGPRRESYRYPA